LVAKLLRSIKDDAAEPAADEGEDLPLIIDVGPPSEVHDPAFDGSFWGQKFDPAAAPGQPGVFFGFRSDRKQDL
jgi:hypothetical protein